MSQEKPFKESETIVGDEELNFDVYSLIPNKPVFHCPTPYKSESETNNPETQNENKEDESEEDYYSYDDEYYSDDNTIEYDQDYEIGVDDCPYYDNYY